MSLKPRHLSVALMSVVLSAAIGCGRSSSSRDATSTEVTTTDVVPADCTNCTPASSCSDGIRNGDEEGVDCGGACTACAATPTCTDGQQNGAETGVDCGGGCPAACASCTDGLQNGSEAGVDCGGECPPCIPPKFYNALTNGTIYSYPDIESVLAVKNFTEVGKGKDATGDIDVFAFEGTIYRVAKGGQVYSYPDIASFAAGQGTLVGTNDTLAEWQDFIVSKNDSGQTWIFAIKPVGDKAVCGLHSFSSIAALTSNSPTYHGSAGDGPCNEYREFFLSSVGDRGAGQFYASTQDGTIYHFVASGQYANKKWSYDFDYGTPEKVGQNPDLGGLNVGIFLY